MPEELEINLDEVLEEIEDMDLEAVRAELVKDKAKQRVASKKYYNPDTAKRARMRATAKRKAMEQKLKEAGIYEDVLTEARELADQQLAAMEVAEGD